MAISVSKEQQWFVNSLIDLLAYLGQSVPTGIVEDIQSLNLNPFQINHFQDGRKTMALPS